MKRLLITFLLILPAVACSTAIAPSTVDYSLVETRYATSVHRDAKGDIVRRADVLREFQKIHPCPSTGLKTGKCLGWAMNHDKTLACGGADAVSNLSWQKNEFKTGFAILSNGKTSPLGYIDENGVFVDIHRYATDRVELKINALSPSMADTAKCVNVVIP